MPPDAPDLEEREDEIVVAGVEVEPLGDDVACGVERRLRLLDGADVGDPRERRDRRRLRVDDDAARDVVEDDGPVGRGRDRLDVRDDAALRRLVVVRRHDEEAVDADLVRPLRQVDRVRRVVRARAGDHRVRVAHLVERDFVEREALVVAQRRRLARRARDDEPVGSVLDEMAAERAEAVERDGAVRVERRRDGCEDFTQHLERLYSGRRCDIDCTSEAHE